ncbi:hypothetical protein AOLI_G00015510 [Acnodon oligacanthus]
MFRQKRQLKNNPAHTGSYTQMRRQTKSLNLALRQPAQSLLVLPRGSQAPAWVPPIAGCFLMHRAERVCTFKATPHLQSKPFFSLGRQQQCELKRRLYEEKKEMNKTRHIPHSANDTRSKGSRRRPL